MSVLRILKSSHGFRVDNISSSVAEDALRVFIGPLVQYAMVRRGRQFVRRPSKVFASSNAARSYYRFHINDFERFKSVFDQFGFRESHFDIKEKKPYTPRQVHIPVKPGWVPKPNQHDPIDYVYSSDNGPCSKLLTLQTGTGKGYCAMEALSRVGHFAVYILRPMYMKKWAKEIAETYDIDPETIGTVQGDGELSKLLKLQKEGKNHYNVVVISNKTFQSWLTKYERLGEKKFLKHYPTTPDNFFEFLQAGFRVIDEVHQDFHLNFKLDTYTHVPNSISLSATLINKDPLLKRVYEIAYPKARQFQAGELNKYIAASTYFFQFDRPEYIEITERGSKNYSHLAYERSILARPEVKKRYFEMIASLVKVDFLDIKSEGEKCIVFFSRIETCRLFCEFLRARLPGRDIRTYVGSEDGGPRDPYENLIDPEIRITTYQSAGTAQDIPMLRTNLFTVSMDAEAGKIQVLGRTREMKNGNTPVFVNLVASNIEKHMAYQKDTERLLRERANSYRKRYHDIPI